MVQKEKNTKVHFQFLFL